MNSFVCKRWGAPIKAMAVVTALALWSNPAPGYELRAAFASECPTTKYPGADGRDLESPLIAVAIATTLTNSIIDTGIAALKKAVNPGNATLEGQFLEQGLYMYKGDQSAAVAATETAAKNVLKTNVTMSSKMGCLVIAAGNFTVSSKGAKGWNLPFKSDRDEPESEDATSSNFRVANALGLEGPATLALYLEAARVFSADRTAVTWKPVRLHVSEYLNGSYWAGQSRSTSVEMRLYKPGKKDAFFSQEFPFPEISKPVNKSGNQLASNNAGMWSELPAAPPVPANLTPLKQGREFDPYTLEIRIVEVPKPYALATAFTDAVEKNKDAIKQDVTDRLNPTAKAIAVLTAQGATIASINNFLDAFKSVVADCSVDKVKDDAGKLACSIARDKASEAKQTAELSCKSNPVASCSSMPKVPDMPT